MRRGASPGVLPLSCWAEGPWSSRELQPVCGTTEGQGTGVEGGGVTKVSGGGGGAPMGREEEPRPPCSPLSSGCGADSIQVFRYGPPWGIPLPLLGLDTPYLTMPR